MVGPFRSRDLAGFTLIEMVITLVIMAIISVVAVPKLGNFLSPSADSARETVLGALRQAKSRAYSHRRLVCVTASAGSLTMVQASANPTISCAGASVPGPDGNNNFLNSIANVSVSASPSSVLYFQPDGRLTNDVAGNAPTNFVLTVTVGTQAASTVRLSGASASPQ